MLGWLGWLFLLVAAMTPPSSHAMTMTPTSSTSSSSSQRTQLLSHTASEGGGGSSTGGTGVTGDGWTDVALKAANAFTISQREKLREEGALGIQRPIKIRAEPHIINKKSQSSNYDDNDNNNDNDVNVNNETKDGVVKIIHFQRHGQGYHNFICDLWREDENKPVIDFESNDPALNPVLRPELLDPPLTYSGILQCKARRSECSHLTPEIVIVSPLVRCLQTAKLSFREHHPIVSQPTTTTSTTRQDKIPKIPWIAHEGCREELGLLVGNKRRPLTDIIEDYPEVDFSFMEYEEDVLWERLNGRRETVLEQSDRIYDFLTEFVAKRPEREMAIVCHSAYLFTMLNAVMEVNDDALRSWFLTSEVRSMKVQFQNNPDYTTTPPNPK